VKHTPAGRGQAGVAGGDGVAALVLQVAQEAADQLGIELGEVDGLGCDLRLPT